MKEVVRFGRFCSENQNISSQDSRKTEKDQRYWVDVWVKKFSLAAKEQHVPDDKIIQMKALVELFIRRNPGSPYIISYATVRNFSKEFGDCGADTLLLFYKFAAISEPHVAVLGGISSEKTINNKVHENADPAISIQSSHPISSEINGYANIKPTENDSNNIHIISQSDVGEKKEAISVKHEKRQRPMSHLQVAMSNTERAELLEKLFQGCTPLKI